MPPPSPLVLLPRAISRLLMVTLAPVTENTWTPLTPSMTVAEAPDPLIVRMPASVTVSGPLAGTRVTVEGDGSDENVMVSVVPAPSALARLMASRRVHTVLVGLWHVAAGTAAGLSPVDPT